MMIIIGATGTVSKSLRQYLSNIPPGKHEIKELQITVILGAAHITGSATVKCKTFQGEITLHVAQMVNREQLQHHIP
jgi:hypothetical protein